ncbi:DMT family transporter [Clostridium chrysemydis]|uniref:DMT family transporter n=1 Tax=Clostridium chrysemydis TaxID=2665504 RepID=UPI002367D69B|nr:DMT family transporter [Clostridium chrysemydis]
MSNLTNNKRKAILFMITASFFFTTMNLFGKLASGVTPYQKTFITNVVATLIVSIIILKRKASFFGQKKNRKYLLIRGIMGTVSICAFYFSLDYLLLSDATMLNKLSPFFAIIFSFLYLKEKITGRQLIFLLLAFFGSIFVIKPHFDSSIIPSLMGVFAALAAGLAYTMIRVIGTSEDFFTVILSFTGIATIVCLPFMFFNTEGLTLRNVIYMILAGICFMLGQVFLTLAYRNAPASEISMFDYIGLIIAAIYGFALFSEIPDYLSIIGYIIIIFASFCNILSKNK